MGREKGGEGGLRSLVLLIFPFFMDSIKILEYFLGKGVGYQREKVEEVNVFIFIPLFANCHLLRSFHVSLNPSQYSIFFFFL